MSGSKYLTRQASRGKLISDTGALAPHNQGDTEMTVTLFIPTIDSCECGCGARNTKKAFQQGHDATLKSILINAIIDGEDITVNDGGSAVTRAAVDHAAQYGFGHQVFAAVETRRYHAARKAEAKAKREANKASKGTVQAIVAIDDAGIAKPVHTLDSIPCTAKVGRWEYQGTYNQDDQTFTYRSAKGVNQTTTKFAIVA